MAVVYILHSKKIDSFYTGSCKDFDGRFEQHLSKFYPNSHTSKADDWTPFLVIDNLSYSQARNIEKHIKKMKSKVYIRNLRKYPNIIHRLKEKYK